MVVIARASFPRRHLNQAVAAYTGLPPLAPEVTKHGPFFQPQEERIEAITCYSLAGHSPAALDSLRERYQSFAAIPGFVCDLQEWREFREFLAPWME